MSLEKYTKKLSKLAVKKMEDQAMAILRSNSDVYTFTGKETLKVTPIEVRNKRDSFIVTVEHVKDKEVSAYLEVPLDRLVFSESEARWEHEMLRMLQKRKAGN